MTDVEIELFADGPYDSHSEPRGFTCRSAYSLGAVERWQGHYDQVIYTIGNSHHHLAALAMLRVRRGVVLAHDVRLTNLYRHENGDPGFLPGGLRRAIERLYPGQLPGHLGATGDLSEADLDLYGLSMAREIIDLSDAFLVTSSAAAALARLDAGPTLAGRVDVVPFVLEAPRLDDGDFFEEADPPGGPLPNGWRSGPTSWRDRSIVAHFGIVDPVKQPALLIEAFAQIVDQAPRPLLAFVGPISSVLYGELAALVNELGVRDDVVFTGAIPTETYLGWLSAASLAVQLRRSFHGEASAAIGECLASGVPTIVSNSGWARELPDDVVCKVDAHPSPGALATVLDTVAHDGQLRRQLADRSRKFAEAQSFTRAAQSLVSLVEDRLASRERRTA